MHKQLRIKAKTGPFSSLSWESFGLLLVSAATLIFEINLTRLYSVAQFYHFAFMVVSIALLGFGASGTFLAQIETRSRVIASKLFPWLAGASGLSMLASFVLINTLPFDSFSIAVDPTQIAILVLHYTALASPFFFSGMIISLMLREYHTTGAEVYAVNLTGSAAGCLAAVLAPSWIDGEGMVALSALLAGISCLFFVKAAYNQRVLSQKNVPVLIIFVSILLIPALLILGMRTFIDEMPAFFQLRISPYKSLSYAMQNPQAQLISSQWNSYSKVDVVSSPSLHSVPGLSYQYLDPLPDIDALFVDGDNLSAILSPDADLNFAFYLPAALAYRLRPDAQTLILEPLGGMDVLAAQALGAGQVTAVVGNPLVIDAAADVYYQAGVNLVISKGRSFLRKSGTSYDIIQLPLTDSYHPVSSGAYALGEDYRYTLEGFEDMLNTLTADGLIVITRWLQEDPSEWLRTFTLAVTALEAQDLEPQPRIIALRGYNTGTLLIKHRPFTAAELVIMRTFAHDKAFDLVYAPELDITEINQYNILPEPVYFQTFQDFLNADPRSNFYRSYPYNVEPPTDNHPFFSHFFKWSQIDDILRTLGVTWQPFGGAGYLVILLIFILALVLATLLILLPVAFFRKKRTRLPSIHSPLFFGLIGLAFMLVEIPLIQRFILYLDQPAYAFAAVLFCILLFSGLGSRFGTHWLSLSKSLMLLTGLLFFYLFISSPLLHATLGYPLIARLAITLLLVGPLGFLMGIPFPSGLTWMRSIPNQSGVPDDQDMISWVWAVNGASSVVASILASLLALSFGFNLTAIIGMSCYLLAGMVVLRKNRNR